MADNRVEKQTISVMVRNHPGVLSHISGLFARRAYNIESITAGVTENPQVTRITIVALCKEGEVDQLIKQLSKLETVIEARKLSYFKCITRELLLVSVHATPEIRPQILQIANIFDAKVVDLTNMDMMLEVSGNDKKIRTFLELVSEYGGLEIARTGQIALDMRSEDAGPFVS